MSKRFFAAAFAIGLAAVLAVGATFVGNNGLALAMTAVIGGVYLLGANELRHYRAASAGLARALEDIPQPLASLGDWLDKVPQNLRNAVRLRVEGERVGLPGPALTPYLVGLLVMLGMLGTFLGMVVTFKGAVFALEGSSDLQAMRSALAGPIKGLALSFGTSVAGVAASAMLGLMSAIARSERLEIARTLESRIAGVLLPFSLVHQRQETFRAIQAQAGTLPDVAAKLEALMARIEQRSEQLDAKLLAGQSEFHRDATAAYAGLADRVGASLKDSLDAGARAAGESIRPVVESAMAQIVRDTVQLHDRVGEGFAQRSAALVTAIDERMVRTQADITAAEQERLQAFARALHAMAGELQDQWRGVADEAGAQAAQAARLLDESAALVHERTAAEARWIAQHGERMDALAALWRSELAALRQEEEGRGQSAVDRLGELQAAVTQHLATLGAALEAPITRMLETAAEVPRAAAGVIAQLREELSRLTERDNVTLQERAALVEQLGVLMRGVNQATGEQRAAVEAMVASASEVMEQAAGRFAETLAAHTGQAAEMSAHITAGAVELAAWGDAFGQGVQGFQASNDKLTETLHRIEASLNKSTARSDEQLAYYVAQAREVIDLSIASQHGVIDSLRQLAGKPAKPLALVEGART